MPSSSSASDRLTSATSRLGRALLKLNAALVRVEEREDRIEELLCAWDQSWEQRRSEILRWLSAADDAPPPESVEPVRSFNLVGMPADADEMTSIIAP
jgi:hypothetical protein